MSSDPMSSQQQTLELSRRGGEQQRLAPSRVEAEELKIEDLNELIVPSEGRKITVAPTLEKPDQRIWSSKTVKSQGELGRKKFMFSKAIYTRKTNKQSSLTR